MAVRVAGLAFRGGAEHGGDVVVAFDVGLLREIQIAAVGLQFAGERGLQIVFGFASLERRHVSSFPMFVTLDRRAARSRPRLRPANERNLVPLSDK